MIPAKEFEGELWIKASDHHQAIKAALAQPAQEQEGPIADGWSINFSNGHSGLGVYAHLDEYPEEGAILLSGVPKWAIDAIKEVRAKPAQEPKSVTYKEVADTMNALRKGNFSQQAAAKEVGKLKLYTTPPKREWVGLTDEEMQAVVDAQLLVSNINVYFKAIEAKLKEKNT